MCLVMEESSNGKGGNAGGLDKWNAAGQGAKLHSVRV